jgi:hypothetical protein
MTHAGAAACVTDMLRNMRWSAECVAAGSFRVNIHQHGFLTGDGDAANK